MGFSHPGRFHSSCQAEWNPYNETCGNTGQGGHWEVRRQQKCSVELPLLVKTVLGKNLFSYMKPSKHQAKYMNQGIFKTLDTTERGETNEVSPMIAPAEFLGRFPGCGAGMETEALGGSPSPGGGAKKLGHQGS